MRSESTSALGQPRLTKPTFGLLRLTDFTLFRRWRDGQRFYSKGLRFAFLPPIRGRKGHFALSNAIRGFCEPAQIKLSQRRATAPQEPPGRSDKDFECVTGPPKWVK